MLLLLMLLLWMMMTSCCMLLLRLKLSKHSSPFPNYTLRLINRWRPIMDLHFIWRLIECRLIKSKHLYDYSNSSLFSNTGLNKHCLDFILHSVDNRIQVESLKDLEQIIQTSEGQDDYRLLDLLPQSTSQTTIFKHWIQLNLSVQCYSCWCRLWR